MHEQLSLGDTRGIVRKSITDAKIIGRYRIVINSQFLLDAYHPDFRVVAMKGGLFELNCAPQL